MADIISFPTERMFHLFDMRELKRMTPQAALKDCLAPVDAETVDYLKFVVFGKWPVLLEMTEAAAFMFTCRYPQHKEAPLVAAAIRAAVDAYRSAACGDIMARPAAYMKALIGQLDRHWQWQAVGSSGDHKRKQAWPGSAQPLPTWLKRNDLSALEFHRRTDEKSSAGRWLMLASRLLPQGADSLFDLVLNERHQEEGRLPGR